MAKPKKPKGKLIWIEQKRVENRFFLVEVHPEASEDDILHLFERHHLAEDHEPDIVNDDLPEFNMARKKVTAADRRSFKNGAVGLELVELTKP
jgi:hypothetical protein